MSTITSCNPLRAPAHITSLLARLHKESLDQEAAIPASDYAPIAELYKRDPPAASLAMDQLMLNRFIALDQDKAEFIYQLIVSSRATSVVEAGTSFGVSTIYLALAVAEAEKLTGKKGLVVGTEKEDVKAEKARGHWRDAGSEIESRIDLRVGDLRETLSSGLDEVHFLLLDIWPPVALPALKAILPKLRPGSLVVTDNTISSEARYKELLSVLRDPEGDFRSATLPFKGGLEVSVYLPQGK